MPSSFTVIISQLLLNQLSDEIYPSIKDKLTQTSSIPALDVSVTWTIVKPPDFELGRDQSTSFILNVAIDLTVTPTGGSPTTTPLQTLATCDISISTDGKLGIAVSNLHFFTDDPFLKEILEAEKIAIISMLQEVLQTIE
ncbi:MAG: hypothetical protein GKS03_12390, partial [Alphaproteobacteria bacterium]|nr:hypothetical protein [Alphaproteobacteria bacterium]